ncbi:hypothetical protein TrCOL_g10221 [Triparma columacea]|uniref:Uncharacterized protein n=1 Tax=Triparma columacea TaxID=722753 RepID=A0A9W7L8W1_9STRA|nr:hypothetical protein TrCOL_g10221 [Triparma columacea]
MTPLLYILPPFLLLCTTTYALSLSNPSAETYRSAYDEFVFNHNPKNALALYDSLPPSPYLWQRGLAAYCAGEYLTAVEQFRFDKKINGNDGEESLWEFASSSKAAPNSGASFLSALPVSSRDSRRVVRDSVALYRDYISSKSGRDRERILVDFLSSFNGESEKDIFYADMYLGLLLDSTGSDSGSLTSHSYYSSALATSYAKASLAQFRSRSTKGDFMVSVVENIVLRQ